MVDKFDFSYYVRDPNKSGKELHELYKETQDYRHVPPDIVSNWRRMVGMRSKIEKTIGRPIDEIDNADVARFVLNNWNKNRSLGKLERIKKPRAKTDNDIDRKLQSYLQYYEAKTANDISSLRQLCALEVAIEKLELSETNLLSDINSRKGVVTETYINSIVNARLRYLAEYRQLQVMLGVDRLTRDKRDTDTGGADYMRSLMRASRDLLESKAVKISCPQCRTEDTILNMGFVLCHFDNWEFHTKCPRCNSAIDLKA